MTITIGQLIFDHATYDSAGDVLSLRAGDAAEVADAVETPEGHVVRYGADGQVIGLTILHAKWLLDRQRPVVVTVPERVAIDPAILAVAMHTAA